MSTPDTPIGIDGLVEEIGAMTDAVYAETCVHEAAHAVFAYHLCVPFDYVTVCPTVTEFGDPMGEYVMAGHVRWKDIGRMTKDSSESWALAVVAPQVALPLFGFERTVEGEFSGDEVALDIIMRFNPKLTRSSLLERAKSMMSNAVRLEIHRLAEELRDRKTLTAEEVRELFST